MSSTHDATALSLHPDVWLLRIALQSGTTGLFALVPFERWSGPVTAEHIGAFVHRLRIPWLTGYVAARDAQSLGTPKLAKRTINTDRIVWIAGMSSVSGLSLPRKPSFQAAQRGSSERKGLAR